MILPPICLCPNQAPRPHCRWKAWPLAEAEGTNLGDSQSSLSTSWVRSREGWEMGTDRNLGLHPEGEACPGHPQPDLPCLASRLHFSSALRTAILCLLLMVPVDCVPPPPENKPQATGAGSFICFAHCCIQSKERCQAQGSPDS